MWAQTVVDLKVASDYGAIFVYDADDFVDRHLDQLAPEGEDVMKRAMDDGTESSRFVGYDDGFVAIMAPSQYNFEAPLRVGSARALPQATEPTGITSPRCRFHCRPAGSCLRLRVAVRRRKPLCHPIRTARGSRGVTSSLGSAKLRATKAGGFSSGPSRSEPTLVKYWQGYDVMAPARS
jgi:hypothetical protein